MAELFSPKTEEKILDFWKREEIFKKSLKNRSKARKFIFFEGPPSANGRPGIHHVLARVYKDIICRYKTMDGFFVGRKAGWDTHGLPVELQVEKELGLKNKKEIEKYGVDKFNQKAEETVWQYKEEWDKLTDRIGFWLDLENPYITYEPHYIESLWHIISKIAKEKLLYRDFKVVPYCTRCGTALSSHEVALGYDRIAENSIYLKFKLKPNQKLPLTLSQSESIRGKKTEKNFFITTNKTYIISWTTTPWTLPGNVALAVGNKINYEILTLKNGEVFIFAKDLRESITEEPKEKSDFTSGRNLIGLEYEPLFEVSRHKSKNSYKIYAADFVNTEEGTGVVHIAPMYGVDDFNLGAETDLPKFHTVSEEGKFIDDFTKGLKNLYVKSAEAENLILNHLKSSDNLLKIKKYEHDYPFCWRCDTPLLYYAKHSWFIRMEKLKKKLLANNKKINWVPSHVKYGRFGEWLNEIKDWAISRERYWGTPLPIWKCEKCENEQAISSLAEFDKFSPKKINRYIFIRHGEAENNRQGVISSYPEKKKYPLTVKGAKEIENLIPWLKKKNADLLFSSDLLRAKETAQIIAGSLGKKVFYDKRLREHDFGTYSGRTSREWHSLFGHKADQYIVAPPGGENLSDVQRRMVDFLKETDRNYQGKTILIVSHANPILAAVSAYQGYGNKETIMLHEKFGVDGITGSTYEMPGHNWPYNMKGSLDLHRPYVDSLELKCPKCSGRMKRVKDVIDVWFDSGAMPFAQYHWPFAKKLEYPADFISEGVDQTRGWFYTLHAIGALMGKGPAYKNVISLGHILDEKGEKMSKSKGNIVDPRSVIDKYGIDALRWYFFTINPPGEPKRFATRDVEERLRRFVLTLSNVLIFYKTYSSKIENWKLKIGNLGLLDRWILSRLNQTIRAVRINLDKYEVTQAARPVDDFVDDLSRWWLRRSRKRFGESDGKNASAVLRLVLEELSKLIAPFTPFLAEYLWHNAGNEESVHLQDFPKAQAKHINIKLEEQMTTVRAAAAKGLALRAEAGIKVRQPLQKFKVQSSKFKVLDKELLELIKEEVNVKEVVLGDKFDLNTKITVELKEEGLIRELARQIQGMRKDAGLTPKDSIKVFVKAEKELKEIIEKWQKALSSDVGAKNIEFLGVVKDGMLIDRHIEIENKPIWIGLAKI